MTADQLDELRAAFGELMGAERRLRGRDPRRPGELSTAQVRALVQLGQGRGVHRGRAGQARRSQPRRDDRDARPARERGHDRAPAQRDRPPPGDRRADRARAADGRGQARRAGSGPARGPRRPTSDAELEAAARRDALASPGSLDGIGEVGSAPRPPGGSHARARRPGAPMLKHSGRPRRDCAAGRLSFGSCCDYRRNVATSRSSSPAVLASSCADAAISCVEALVCCVEAETCSLDALADSATVATPTTSCAICSASPDRS